MSTRRLEKSRRKLHNACGDVAPLSRDSNL